LDPTARRLKLPGGRQAVLTDTVGFVRKLPHQLVEAFRSTLEETVQADLLLHVVDAARAGPDAHVEAVASVLTGIGAGDVPQVLTLNKTDLLTDARREELSKRFPEGILISAATGEGLDRLLEALASALARAQAIAVFELPFGRGDLRSELYRTSEVLEETSVARGMRLVARTSPSTLARFSDYLAVEGGDATGSGGSH
ncbi:MAG: GTPase, partial [Actinomycetota bacterium]